MAVYLISFLFFVVLAYVVVLAIVAPQIAITEKDCPRSTAAGEDWLFPMVIADRSYDGYVARMATTGLGHKAIDTTLMGAYIACS
jgi:hypothetical protein